MIIACCQQVYTCVGQGHLLAGAAVTSHAGAAKTLVGAGRRVMYGDMHVRAFDWAEPEPGGDPCAPRRAALVMDRVVHVRARAQTAA